MGEKTGNCLNGRHHTCKGYGYSIPPLREYVLLKGKPEEEYRYKCECECHKKINKN